MSIFQGNIALTSGSGGGAVEQVFIATYGETTYAEIKEAYDAGKVCFCKNSNNLVPMFSLLGTMAVFTAATTGKIVIYRVSSTDVWVDVSHNVVNEAGDTMTGHLTLNADPTENLHAATKQYVDNAMGSVISQAFHAGTTAPSNTKLLWIDTGNDSIMKYYNGSTWAIVGSTWG